MRVYQLEYEYDSLLFGGSTRAASFFYRPEFISDVVIWKAVRQGNDIVNDDDLDKEAFAKGKSTEEAAQER